MKTRVQFIIDIDESTIPNVQLTRSVDGSTGTATFLFQNPSIFEKSFGNGSQNDGEITGLRLIDEEGTLFTSDVKARFINGKPTSIEALLFFKEPYEWDRFMRFMTLYSEEYGLTFIKPEEL